MISLERKYKVISDYKKTATKIYWADSIGIGDTLNDIGIFEHTDIKVALNPDFELYGWIKTIDPEDKEDWHVAPDCCALSDSILNVSRTSIAVADDELKLIAELEKVCAGKIKVPAPLWQLPVEYRQTIHAAQIFLAYGQQYKWSDAVVVLFNEKVAKSAHIINTNQNNPRYNYPGRAAFTEIWKEIWDKQLPEGVRKELDSKKS